MKIFIAFAALLSVTNGKSYENFQTLRVETPDRASREKLSPLESSLNIWSDIPGRHVDVMVDPIDVEAVKKFLKTESLNFQTMIPNVGDLIRAEKVRSVNEESRSIAKHSMSWTEYHSLADIQSYIDYLVKTFPDLVQQETIGKTFQGRSMNLVKICKGGCGNKPGVWIDGGIHAREWISPATVTYMLRQLAEIQNPADSDLLDKLDWYILPVVNPDGYEYTRDPKGDRIWRKTRSTNSGSECVGVDANRNFGFHFNEGGSSSDPCSDSYHGTGPFSEKETQNIRDFINAHNNSIKFYSSIHSFSQFVLLPWGFTTDKPSNYDKLLSFANKGNDALRSVNGLNYTVGCIPCILYVASGGSIDWTLGVAGIPYSLAMELRDTGLHGFLLPPDQIIPTGEETWAFHKTGARQIIEEFGNHGSSSFNVSILAYTLGLILSTLFGRKI